MYVVVIGLGQVGRHLVRTLELERHDIAAIDVRASCVAEIEENHDVMTLVGYGASDTLLREAAVGRADLVVAVTDNDEVNLIAALASKQMGAKRVIARVQSPEWAQGGEGVRYGMLGVDVVINPRILVASEIAKIARSHGALNVIELADDRIEMVQVELASGSKMVGTPIADLNMPEGTLVAAMVVNGVLEVPGGTDVLQPSDRVYILGQPNAIEEAETRFTGAREARRVAIVGAGVIGTAVAALLCRDGTDVLMIERSIETAEAVGARLDRCTVVHGDGTDLSLLQSENVGGYDLFIAASHDDEVNLMAGLLAKRAGCKRTLAVVHRPDYMQIYRQLGIDIVLSPRVVASDHILRFTRSSTIKSLTVLEEGQAEVLELVAHEGSRVCGVPIRRLNLRGALLAAIEKPGGVIIPRGDDEIEPGDVVIVLAKANTVATVARMFSKRKF